MNKIIDLDDLLSYHNELASHIQLLTRDTSYSVGDIVQYDGRYFKCTTAGDTDTNRPDFSTTDPYTDGTVEWTEFNPNSPIYEIGKSYKINDLVVYDNRWYKCINAHTSYSSFDYSKFVEIGSIVYNQKTKLGVSANTTFTIPIEESKAFIRPPIEVLKFNSTNQNDIITLNSFSASESGEFIYDSDKLVFDGDLHMKTSYDLTMSTPTALGSGYISQSNMIDIDDYAVIEGVNVK